jgi:hypothetical protein
LSDNNRQNAETFGIGARKSRRFPVDPQRVLKLHCDGLTLEQIADKFVGVSAREMGQALDYALFGNDDREPAPIPQNLPRVPPPDSSVAEVYAIEKKQPGFGNTLRDMRIACDKSVVETFEKFLADGKVWNGTTNVPSLNPARIRASLLRRGRSDLWEKLNPGNVLRVPASKHPVYPDRRPYVSGLSYWLRRRAADS